MSLKITYVIPGLKYSGGIIHVMEEAKELKKKGHCITIFAPYSDLNKFPYYSELYREFKFIPGLCPDISYLSSIRHPVRLVNTLLSIRKMARELGKFIDKDTDIVVADWYWTVFGAYIARKRNNAGYKIVLKIQNPPQKEIKKAVGCVFSFLCRKAVAQADYIATVSEGAGSEIKKYFHRDSINIGNGVREIFFKNADPVKKEEFLKSLYISGQRILLYAGGLNRQKGIEVLLKVMAGLKNNNIVLLIAGDGGRRYYEKMARHLGVANLIRWLGEISPEKLPLVYQISQVFIFPSWFEGFGLPPLEAMASGIPVVLTDTEGAREYARPDINSIVAQPGDVEALSKGVLSILDDPAVAKRLTDNARRTAREFSWSEAAGRAEKLYNRVA